MARGPRSLFLPEGSPGSQPQLGLQMRFNRFTTLHVPGSVGMTGGASQATFLQPVVVSRHRTSGQAGHHGKKRGADPAGAHRGLLRHGRIWLPLKKACSIRRSALWMRGRAAGCSGENCGSVPFRLSPAHVVPMDRSGSRPRDIHQRGNRIVHRDLVSLGSPFRPGPGKFTFDLEEGGGQRAVQIDRRPGQSRHACPRPRPQHANQHRKSRTGGLSDGWPVTAEAFAGYRPPPALIN